QAFGRVEGQVPALPLSRHGRQHSPDGHRGLKVAHLRLVIGSSLGCMHSFMWAEMYPELIDGIVGLSCQPVEIRGRNWIPRRAAAEAIRHDPDWKNGNYDKNRPITSTARRRDRSCPRAPRA